MNAESLPNENPFSSRYVRPGAMPYRYPPGVTADSLVADFRRNGRRGAILGPHGSGKSTLVEDLLPKLCTSGGEPRVVVLRDGERRPGLAVADAASADGVLVVDGFEQLNWPGRIELQRIWRRSGCGLLITSHATVRRVPTLFTCRSTIDSLRELVAELTRDAACSATSPDELRRLFDKHGGNLREIFFELYDLYERQRLRGR